MDVEEGSEGQSKLLEAFSAWVMEDEEEEISEDEFLFTHVRLSLCLFWLDNFKKLSLETFLFRVRRSESRIRFKDHSWNFFIHLPRLSAEKLTMAKNGLSLKIHLFSWLR